MNIVHSPEPNVLELNFMWLPSWIALNNQLMRELAEEARERAMGRPITPELLWELDAVVVQSLVERFPITNLREHLMSLYAVGAGQERDG